MLVFPSLILVLCYVMYLHSRIEGQQKVIDKFVDIEDRLTPLIEKLEAKTNATS